MAKAIRIAWIGSMAAGGTLLGHAIAYALEGRSLADGHHGYFGPLLELVLAAGLLACALIAGRAVTSRDARRVPALPGLPRLWLIVASLQVAGFVTLEFLEGNAPNALGCGVEALTALFVAVAITLFCRGVERLAHGLLCAYARRLRPPSAAPRHVRLSVDAARCLAVRVGVRRFQRPPPLSG